VRQRGTVTGEAPFNIWNADQSTRLFFNLPL
jgi:hypothetical protein